MTDHIQAVDYKAPLWCKNRHVQSLLATVKLRKIFVKKRARSLINHASEHIVQSNDGAKLQSFVSLQENKNSPMVILIHGWEGSHESLYLLSAANHLFQSGYHVVRLNLRDHGTSHHLNPELFHSNRLAEVIDAVAAIERQYTPTQLHLCGFSLGGNFVLRVANSADSLGINLSKVIAICPALNPADILLKLETSLSIYIKYFMFKWKRSLRKKQYHFPELYDIERDLQTDSMRELTEKLVAYYGDYASINEYFEGYNITGNTLNRLRCESHILLAKDDPIIDFKDIYSLPNEENISLYSSENGGHCGFIKNIQLHSWLDDFIIEILKDNTEHLST